MKCLGGCGTHVQGTKMTNLLLARMHRNRCYNTGNWQMAARYQARFVALVIQENNKMVREHLVALAESSDKSP